MQPDEHLNTASDFSSYTDMSISALEGLMRGDLHAFNVPVFLLLLSQAH